MTHDRRFITPDDLVLEIQDGQLVQREMGAVADHSTAYSEVTRAGRPRLILVR